MIKVGAIGVGMMGQYHARIYFKLDCELVGVADKNFEKAKRMGEMYSTNYYKNYEYLLEQADAVSVAVPTSAQEGLKVLEIALKACKKICPL